ncbi:MULTISPECIES: MFS transporter [Arthrobacter]|uniref:MFS transporter n=2 Tax=Arthrobacter TaxID=1663 RepID=A0ABU9KPG2_9MICC|nr:MFS transporter [Arthrobacter sp. YJM1]MDP5227774.1 MFS transporter [Arthrobacter sp. YJM1]
MTTTLTPQTSLRTAPWRKWTALALLMVPVLLVAVDNTALTFALPAITSALHASGVELLWIIDAYPLVLAALLVAMGNLGDRIGRRKLLMIGSTGFGLASIAAAFSPTAGALIAGRAALGLFGATLMPSTLSLIRNIFTDANQRRLAIAIWAAVFSGGAAVGPILGGWLVDHFWWGAVLIAPAVLLIPLLAFGTKLIPESKDSSPHPVDLPSILLSILAMGPLAIAIKELTVHGLQPLPIALAFFGVGMGVVFVRRQLRIPYPMLDMSLFANPVFSTSISANVLSFTSMTGFIFFFSQHLQLVTGLTPLDAGLLMLPASVATIIAGLASVPLVRAVRPGLVVAGGLFLSTAAYFLVALLGEAVGMPVYLLAVYLLSIGIGAAETISNDLIMSSVPAEKAGAASAISETGYEFGALLGTAVLGSILTASYQQHLRLPAGLSDTDASAARETLAGAVDVAHRVGGELGAQLTTTAQHAFDSGVTVTAAIGALLMAAVTVAAAVGLRKAPRATKESQQELPGH